MDPCGEASASQKRVLWPEWTNRLARHKTETSAQVNDGTWKDSLRKQGGPRPTLCFQKAEKPEGPNCPSCVLIKTDSDWPNSGREKGFLAEAHRGFCRGTTSALCMTDLTRTGPSTALSSRGSHCMVWVCRVHPGDAVECQHALEIQWLWFA